MRRLVVVLGLPLVACTGSIEGHYLSEEAYLRIYRENERVFMQLSAYNIKPSSTPIELQQGDDGVYRGKISGLLGLVQRQIALSKTDEGLVAVGGGEKFIFRPFDPDTGRTDLDPKSLQTALERGLLENLRLDLQTDSYTCGRNGLSKRKRQHLQSLLDSTKLIAAEEAKKHEGVLFDSYEVDFELQFPTHRMEQENQRVCVRSQRDWGRDKCLQYRDMDFSTETDAYSVRGRARYHVARFAHVQPKPSELEILQVSEYERRTFAQVICRNTLAVDSRLNYRESRTDAAHASAR